MIRTAYINSQDENLKAFLRQYIRENTEDVDDGMFFNVKTITKTISGTDYYATQCTAQIGTAEVPVVEFCFLNDGTFRVDAYYNGTSSTVLTKSYKQSSAISGMQPVNKVVYAYGTDNGFMLYFQVTEEDATHPPIWFSVMVTKGNDGYPFIVMPSNANSIGTTINNVYDTVVVHVTDSSYCSAKLFMLPSQNQTALCPFMGYGSQFEVSNTPYAFFAVQATEAVRNSGFAVMKFNSETDGITNGYWVIFDGKREDEST